MEHHNYCTQENGVKICNVSSVLPNCSAENILLSERKNVWMSLAGLPQSITLDLTEMQERPRFIKCFGFDCWHDYTSNPSVIELWVSTDGENFITWITIYPELKQGIQLFQIDPLGSRYKFIKIFIKETFGGSKTYLNQVLLLEEYAAISTESVTESHQQTENGSQYRQIYEEQQIQVQNNEYIELAQKIENMGKEVASLKQSHANKQQAPSVQVQKQQQQKCDITFQDGQQLTSTERMVNTLKGELQMWKQKSETLEANMQQMTKMMQQLIEKQHQQDELISQLSQKDKATTDNKKRINDNKENQVSAGQLENIIDKKIQELSLNFQSLLNSQEQKFKQQQQDLINKIKQLIKQRSESSSKQRKSPESQRSSSSSIELRKSHRHKSNKSRQSRQKHRSNRDSKSPTPDSDRYSPKQKKVASLLGKLQEKLQQRARKIEQLNISQRKTRNRSNHRHNDSFTSD
ncbi:hypothetical protein pb186bvf_002523 [Paramecium bursaria]